MLRYSDIRLQMANGQDGVTPGIDQVYAYLSARGVSREEIDELGLYIVPAHELIERTRGAANKVQDPRLAVVFPHADAAGNAIDWWSARLVDAGLRPMPKGFAAHVEMNWGKMFCPPNEPPHGYLVPSLDWSKLQRGDKVYIHESCIKAINGARLGYWSVGLNGVRGWSSRKHQIALVDELRGLPWKALDLKPVICFDSNAEDNWDVQHAISSLAAKLYEVTGQKATHLLLPRDPQGQHWGFDDYAVHHGDTIARTYLDGDGTEVEISGFEQLRLELNAKVCVVRSLGRIAEQDTGTLMTRGTFTDVNYAHFVTPGEDDKQVNVPKIWLTDSRRTEVEGIEYVPGGPAIEPGRYLNRWRGMGTEPMGGDVSLWLSLLEHNVSDEKLRKWIIQWMAYPLQHLGSKLTTYMHMWGPPGTGKQALLAPLMRIYGSNSVVIGKREITSDFNSIYAARQFINVDELHGGNETNALAVSNKVKMLVTGETITVNKKGDPEYVIRNCAQLVTTSNYLDAIRLDKDDRRCSVIHYGNEQRWSKEQFTEYWQWVESGGAEAVYQYLLEYDLTGFDPKGWAPDSEHKKEMSRATASREQAWVEDLMENPDAVLGKSTKAVFTTKDLATVCYRDDPAGVTAGKTRNLGMRLSEAGVKKVELWLNGGKERVWVVRHADREWSAEDVREHLKTAKDGKY